MAKYTMPDLDKPDVCSRCSNLKSVKKLYTLDPDNRYRVQGKCDRCGSWGFDLWSLVRKPVLDRLAEV
jgi:hypothetical protein